MRYCHLAAVLWSLAQALAPVLVVLTCQRDVAAVLSLRVSGPAEARVRTITLDVTLGGVHRSFGFSQPDAFALDPPRSLDVTFRDGQTGGGTVDLRAVDEASSIALRGCIDIRVEEGRTTTFDVT